jgi:hypothetical protein
MFRFDNTSAIISPRGADLERALETREPLGQGLIRKGPRTVQSLQVMAQSFSDNYR